MYWTTFGEGIGWEGVWRVGRRGGGGEGRRRHVTCHEQSRNDIFVILRKIYKIPAIVEEAFFQFGNFFNLKNLENTFIFSRVMGYSHEIFEGLK